MNSYLIYGGLVAIIVIIVLVVVLSNKNQNKKINELRKALNASGLAKEDTFVADPDRTDKQFATDIVNACYYYLSKEQKDKLIEIFQPSITKDTTSLKSQQILILPFATDIKSDTHKHRLSIISNLAITNRYSDNLTITYKEDNNNNNFIFTVKRTDSELDILDLTKDFNIDDCDFTTIDVNPKDPTSAETDCERLLVGLNIKANLDIIPHMVKTLATNKGEQMKQLTINEIINAKGQNDLITIIKTTTSSSSTTSSSQTTSSSSTTTSSSSTTTTSKKP